jgi:tetratricopeptide (TPR) repeat protein
VYTEKGEYTLAEEYFQQALSNAEKSEDAIRKSRALLNLGAYNMRRGDHTRAQTLLEESLELSRRAGDANLVGLALGNLADVYLRQDNPSYAMRLLKEATPNLIQNSQQAPYLLGRLGQAHLVMREPDKARKYLIQAARLAEQYNQPEQEIIWANLLADLFVKENHFDEALRLYQRVNVLAEQVKVPPPEHQPNKNLVNTVQCLYRLNQLDEAIAMGVPGLQTLPDNSLEKLEMLTVLGAVYQAKGQNTEASSYLEQSLVVPFPTDASQLSQAKMARARALTSLGSIYQDSDQLEKALELLEKALDQTEEDDYVGRAQTLKQIGMVLQKRNDLEGALSKWSEALGLFESRYDYAQAARLLCDMGAARRSLVGIKAAMADYDKAVVAINRTQDLGTRGLVISNIANVYTDLGEVETARSYYEESIDLARRTGNRRGESLRLGNFGWYHIMIGQPRDAITLLEKAIMISRELKETLYVAVQTNNLGQANHEMGAYVKAEGLYEQALQMVKPDTRWEALFKANLGRSQVALGKLDEGIVTLFRAVELSRSMNESEIAARALARLAEGYMHQGKLDEADKLAAEGQSLASKFTYRKGQGDALYVRAQIAEKRGDSATNRKYLEEAWKVYNILHDPLAEVISRTIGRVPA